MHFFTDYLQLITLWVYDNPNWALFIAFLMSFAESLAIVGSIIPGGVTMTAIGILAGSGVMDISLTLIAAATGAVVGDGASYALGYAFSDQLVDIWPFRRYPLWLRYGESYFERHGGKSVIIGRFFGPLRSIIPVIAGILRMNPWHFLFANIISAIGWALLYVVPGILIGAASAELSSESATRLFVFILVLLAFAWIVSKGVKWLYHHARHVFYTQLRKIWIWSKKNPSFASALKALTPSHVRTPHTTIGLILLLMLCFFLSTLILLLVIQGTWIADINNACYLFLQSLRTQSFDSFFIVISLMISPLSLLTFIFAITFFAIVYRDWRMLRYWTSITIITGTIAFLLALSVETPKPTALIRYLSTPTFPALNLTIATALFGFLIGYATTYYRTTTMFALRIILTTLLILSGLALLYLGDNWATGVVGAYVIGLTVCLAHWIYYHRRQSTSRGPLLSPASIVLTCSLLLLTTGIASSLYYKKLMREHSPYVQQYVLTHQTWWNQNQPLLPVYTKNRIGKRTGVFNIQYLGSLSKFEQSLVTHGWKKQPDSLLYSLLMRASGQNSGQELPLMAQLYLNKKPALIMTFPSSEGKSLYILRLWRSNYHLRNYRQPIWLGSMKHLQTSLQMQNLTQKDEPEQFIFLLPALDHFHLNTIALPAHPKLLLIESKS